MRGMLRALSACLTATTVVVVGPPASADVGFTTEDVVLNVRLDATTGSGVVTQLDGATAISVDCQQVGETITDGDESNEWWAHIPALGGYVSAVYIEGATGALPDVPECEAAPEPVPAEITYDDLLTMFPGKVGDQAVVEEGLPTLDQAMVDAEINTPYRQAAYLATLANESVFLYNIVQSGGETYTGRGYIQIGRAHV